MAGLSTNPAFDGHICWHCKACKNLHDRESSNVLLAKCLFFLASSLGTCFDVKINAVWKYKMKFQPRQFLSRQLQLLQDCHTARQCLWTWRTNHHQQNNAPFLVYKNKGINARCFSWKSVFLVRNFLLGTTGRMRRYLFQGKQMFVSEQEVDCNILYKYSLYYPAFVEVVLQSVSWGNSERIVQ